MVRLGRYGQSGLPQRVLVLRDDYLLPVGGQVVAMGDRDEVVGGGQRLKSPLVKLLRLQHDAVRVTPYQLLERLLGDLLLLYVLQPRRGLLDKRGRLGHDRLVQQRLGHGGGHVRCYDVGGVGGAGGVGVGEGGVDVGVGDVGAGPRLGVVLDDVDDPVGCGDELVLFSLDRDDALGYRGGSLRLLREKDLKKNICFFFLTFCCGDRFTVTI